MKRCLFAFVLLFVVGLHSRAETPFDKVAQEVNSKMVKIYGAGGFKGVNSYGSGIVISEDGFILTANSPLLDTQDLRVHLYDGRKLRAAIVAREPAFDAAVLYCVSDRTVRYDPKNPPKPVVKDLPHFDFNKAVDAVKSGPGDWVLAFSNCFQIAVRDEPMTVMRGVISAQGKLVARRGALEIPFLGDVYFLDAITNGPGAAGGALTTRKGELIGIIGREYRNTATDTWVNYAIPINTKADVLVKGEKKTVTFRDFVNQGIKGEWSVDPIKPPDEKGFGAFTGIIFVPDLLERTPPYIEAVIPDSPAAKAGLKPDDLLIYFDGEPVYSLKAYKSLLSRYSPGEKVQIEIRRGEKVTALTLELAPQPKK
jgi:serine protease Do